MVLGLTRERTTLARRAPVLERTGPVYGWDDWLIERGSVQWEASADLTGGFPGFAAQGCRLEGCQVRVTERFLLVNEGKGNGFGLPLGWLVDADVIPSPLRGDRGEVVLRVRYNDRDRVRTFLVRFRGPFLALRGPRRAEQALAALRGVGLDAGPEELPPLPEIAHTWLEAARFEQENVIWSGVASAAAGPGRELEPCDVWLTTRSVIWGGSMGDGVLRLSLDRVLDVVAGELDGRGRTPVLYLACADEAGGRHDLPFIFDRQHPAQRCHRERGALLVGLRSRGIPLGTTPEPPRPWQSALARVAADEAIEAAGTGPLDQQAGEVSTISRFRVPSTGARVSRMRFSLDHDAATETDDPAAWALGPEHREAMSYGNAESPITILPATGQGTGAFGRGALTLLPWRLDESPQPDAAPDAIGVPLEPEEDEAVRPVVDDAAVAGSEPPVDPAPVPDSAALKVVEAIENALVAVLVEAARGIDQCLDGSDVAKPVCAIPSGSDQAAAHTALDTLLSEGILSVDEAHARRGRLAAVGEAGPRLRSLLELHQANLLTDAQLAARRAEIIAPLACMLKGAEAAG
jgi:hypothetical protein